MQAVKAGQGGLANALSTTEKLDHEITDDRNSRGDSRNNFDGPVTELIPRQGVASNAEGDSDHRHGDASNPGELPWALETTGEINPEDVQDQHQHHHGGAPAVHRPDQPAKADVGHEVLDRGIGLSHRWLVIEGHRKPSGELDQEANQGDAAQAIKNVDVGWHVFGRDVVGNRLDLKALVEPVVNRVRSLSGVSSRSVRHAAGVLVARSYR